MYNDNNKYKNNNRRLAKNISFLYIRLIVIMFVKLYTSRAILQILGISDFGIWSVVSAFVLSFSFVSSPLVTATQRFLNFDMGRGGKNLGNIFNVSFELFLFVGFILFLLLEFLGTWFLNNKMQFPVEKLDDVNIVYQFVVLSIIISFLRMPYESVVISYESMNFYAVVSIVEASLLLINVYMLDIFEDGNKLVLYGLFSFLTQIIITLVFKFYCNRYFECSKINFVKDRKLIKEIGNFASWNCFGAMAAMCSNSGLNVLINTFFGVVANAAFGISNQILAAVNSVVQNLQKASNPQLVKYYSEGNVKQENLIVSNICKYSFLLVLLLIVPAIINMDFLLNEWLGENTPNGTSKLCIVMLLGILFSSFGTPIDTVVFATGKIKIYQLLLSSILMLNIILSFILFTFGFSLVFAAVVKIFVEIILLSVRLFYYHKNVLFDTRFFLKKTIMPLLVMTILAAITYYVCKKGESVDNNWMFVIKSSAIFFVSFVTILLIIERKHIFNLIKYFKQ